MTQFGGSGPDGDYGFFGGQKPAGGATPFGGGQEKPSTFSGAPSAPPEGFSPTFGAPTAGSSSAWGAPPPLAPAAPAKRRRSKKTALGIIVLLLLGLGAAWFVGRPAWTQYQSNQPAVVPLTLSGAHPATDPGLQKMAPELQQQLAAHNPGIVVASQVYGKPKHFTILGILRAPVDVDREFSDARASLTDGGTLSQRTTVGTSTCVSLTASKAAFCLRSTPTLTVEVAIFGGTEQQAAAAVDEAWAQQ